VLVVVTAMAVGRNGVAVFKAVVVMLGGADARFVAVNANGPPTAPRVIFFKAKVVGLAALVKTQVICAAGTTFAAGMVSNWPTKLPKVPVFPVTAEFASVQLALVRLNRAFAFSDICTTLFSVETLIAEGAAGVGVDAAVVVMAAGTEARLATENVKGPPGPPVVDFCSFTVAGQAVLVRVQLICAAGMTLAAGTVSTLPAKLPKLAGLPVKLALASVQVAAVVLKLALAASVIWICVPVVVI
jgi:hypothetical protein